MQVIEYASLPNTKEIAYLPTIMKALGEIKRSTPTFKEFRDWLKEQMLWDKEAWPVVWPLLDVKVGERLHLGDFAAKLLATDDEDEARKLLYQRLLKRNEILCKYVFEALDERLHSTHELYRLITSYVYPGEYITLVNFQHWIKWMAAIGYIKFVGIRWGLSEIARAEIERIKQIDVEEILEDERLEREVAKSRKPEDEAGAAAAEGAPAEGAVPVAASAGGFDPPDDDDFDGPEAHFVEDVDPDALRATSNAAPAAQQTGAPARGASSKSATASRASAASASTTPVTVTPLPRVEHRRYVIPQISSDDLLASVNRIKAWWANYADKKLYQVSDFGLASTDYAADRLKFLFKVVCIGRLVVHDDLSPVYYPFVEELQKRRVFDRLFAEESLEMLLGEVDYFSGNPWFARAAENFVPFLALRQRLKANDSIADQLSDARSGRELVTRLWEALYGRTLTIEPFFVVREMVRMRLWDNPAFETVSVVPTYTARTNMFRLGFLDSLYCDTFEQLIEAAEKLSRYFGPENHFEAPLVLFDRGQGCAFRCGRTATCEYACREKYGV